MLLILIILILVFGGGGLAFDGPYRTGGISLGGILLVVLIIMLLTGRLGR